MVLLSKINRHKQTNRICLISSIPRFDSKATTENFKTMIFWVFLVSCHAAMPDLHSLYTFDEVEGDKVRDASHFERDAVLRNGAKVQHAAYGNALNLPGSNAQMLFDSLPEFTMGAIFSAWIHLRRDNGREQPLIRQHERIVRSVPFTLQRRRSM